MAEKVIHCPKCANEANLNHPELKEVKCELVRSEVTEKGVNVDFYRCPRCKKIWRVCVL